MFREDFGTDGRGGYFDEYGYAQYMLVSQLFVEQDSNKHSFLRLL